MEPGFGSEWLRAFAALFAIANPIAAAPAFLGITAEFDPADRRRAAGWAALAVFVILGVAALAGRGVLAAFGISLDAFRAGGGLVIVLMGLEMLGGRRTRAQEHSPATDVEGSVLVPFAMPLVSGPGAITTVVTLTAARPSPRAVSAVVLAVAALAAALLVSLLVAVSVGDWMSERGHAIFTRFMGLLLVAIGAQFLLSGVAGFFG